MKKAIWFPLILFVFLLTPVVAQDPDPAAATPPQEQQQEQPQAAVAAPENEDLKKGTELNAAKQYTEAESALRAAVAAQPDNPTAHLQLAVSLFEQNKVTEAATELDQAKALEQGTEQQQADFYQYRGAVNARLEKWEQAVQDLEKAVKLDPMEPYNHYYLGVAYSKQKRPDKMVEHLQMFLKLAPNSPEAPKCRALLRAVQ